MQTQPVPTFAIVASLTQTPLSQLNYEVECMPGRFGAFKVFNNKENNRYIVDCRDMTCNCPDFRFHQHKPHYQCKHISGLRELIMDQIAVCAKEKEQIAEEVQKGGTFRQVAAWEEQATSVDNF